MDLVRARDPDALASFYDGHAARANEYCALVYDPDHVDDAPLATFVDFLGRLASAGADVNLDELLWKVTRGAAAGRAEVRAEVGVVPVGAVPVGAVPASPRSAVHRSARTEPSATCFAMPELLAASASGELRHRQVDRHLVDCSVCQAAVERFRQAEGTFAREPREQPSGEIRRAWLEIARGHTPAE